MPRRRRKRPLDSMRPALTFLESPVHVERSPPSPVYCSDHPATAKVVPLEEAPQWTWVSPQFENRGRHTGMHRRRHNDVGHNSTMFTRLRTRKNVKSPTKFQTLEFQQISQQPPSPVQQLRFDENSDTLRDKMENQVLSKIDARDGNENVSEDESGGPITRSRASLQNTSVDKPADALTTPQGVNASIPDSPYSVHTPTGSATPKRNPGLIYQHLFSNEFQTPVGRRPGDLNILAYDTPEEEYGVPVRLRGKKLRRRQSKTKLDANTNHHR